MEEASKKKFDFPPRYIENKIKTCNILLNGNTPDTWNNCKVLEFSSQNITLNHLFAPIEIQNPTFLAIVGPSGSGKTTLIKQFLKEYSEKEILFGAKYVFYIQFADIDLNYKSNRLEFLASTLPCHWLLNATVSTNVLNQAFKAGKICIIIDNFIVENINFPKTTLDLDTSETVSNGETHLLNILSGKAFPEATVLVTFQPSQFLKLPIAFKPDSFTNISGITKNDQKELSKQISKEYSDEILFYINTYPTLNKFCLLPANCFATIHIIKVFLSLKSDAIPLLCFPMTQIFVASLSLVFLDKGLKHSHCNLSYIVEWCWKNFTKKNLNFDKFYIKEKHTREVFETFVQLAPPKSFLSLSNGCFNEVCLNFFVAVFLLYFDDDCANFNEYLKNNLRPQVLNANMEFREISKFLFGLCNDAIFDYIEELLPSSTLSYDKSKRLTEFLLDMFCKIKTEQLNLFSTLLFISSLAFEMHSDYFREKLANTYFPDEIYVSDDCCVSDLIALVYILQAREMDLRLCGVSCFTGENKNFFLEAKKLLININHIQ